MKASILILAGFGLAVSVGLSGCEGYSWSRDHDHKIDLRTDKEKADACVAAFEPDGKAPQVMTYDSTTKTETHMTTEGRDVAVTAQNSTDNTALGMGGHVGGNIPQACTDADTVPAAAVPKDHHYKDANNGYH